MTVVSDASPIIALDRIGRLDLLSGLYETVLIPSAVEKELLSPGRFRIPRWIDRRELHQPLSHYCCSGTSTWAIASGHTER